eukprot:scaffold125730_cov16-Tisochrysis_lutea.AAC.1
MVDCCAASDLRSVMQAGMVPLVNSELVLLRSLWDFAVPSLDVKTGIVPVLHLRPFLYASHVHSQVVMLKTGATTIWQKDALCTMVGTKWHVYELSAMDSAKCSC